MKKIYFSFAAFLFVFISFSFSAQAEQSNCQKACVHRMTNLFKGCSLQYHFRKNRCNKWSKERISACSQQKSKARSRFCSKVYGKRIYSCFNWVKNRRQSCLNIFQKCLKSRLVHCTQLCHRSSRDKNLYQHCKKVNSKICVLSLRTCSISTKKIFRSCKAYAKQRRQGCIRTIYISVRACRAYAKRASASCLNNALSRYHACHRYTQQLRSSCFKRCK